MANNSSGGGTVLPSTVADVAALRFYARHFGKLVAANLLLVTAVMLLFGWHAFTERREVDREYFGLDFRTGRMVRLVPLGMPYLSNQSMLTRVQECIQDVNTYDFVNHQKSFQRASGCFTDDGWNAFAAELNRVGTLKQVKNLRLVAQAVAAGVPVITTPAHQRNGVLTWEIQMPVRISFAGGVGGRGLATQNLLVTVTVQRVPEYLNEHGIGIVQYVAEERRA